MSSESEKREEVSRSGHESLIYAALVVSLLCFHLAANLWWLSADNHTIRTDEEGHMQMAREHFEALFPEEPCSLLARLTAMSKIKLGNPAHPPLLHIAGALMLAAFGYSVDTLAVTNTLFFLFLLWGCLLLCRRLMKPWPALFATYVVSFTPGIYASSRYFMTDYASTALVVWTMYALIRSDRFRDTGWVFAFAVLNGLGILTRTATFIYYLTPATVAAAAGFLSALSPSESGIPRRFALRRVSLNCVFALVVSVGVFSPWYFAHLEEFQHYWLDVHPSSAGKGGPVALVSALAAEKAPGDTVSTKPEAGAPRIESKKSRFSTANAIHGIMHPETPWRRYIVYTINNGVFLPLFLFAIVGLLAGILLRRLRSFEFWLVVCWILGSWVMLTVLFRFSNPRYALQVLPALGISAGMAVCAPSKSRIRSMLGTALMTVLLFQYGNLTVRAYGPLARFYLPFEPDRYTDERYDDAGLAVWKDLLTLGFSYSRLSAPEKENFKDRIFEAMVRAEHANPYLPGEYANYLRLDMRGMEFDQQHYWRGSRYQRRDWPAGALPRRRLRSIGASKTPEGLLAKLANADYVVYTVEQIMPELEQHWLEFFQERGFMPIERFAQDRFGLVPALYYGVLARRAQGEVIQINTPADIDRLEFYDLYEFLQSLINQEQRPDLREYARKRFAERVAALGAAPFSINEYVSFYTADVTHVEENWYQFRFLFRVDKAMDKNWRMYFHAKVAPENVAYLPEESRSQGLVMWNFDPDPPTGAWKQGEYVIITHRIQAEPIPYRLTLGFFLPEEGYFGRAIPIGWVDFRNVLEKASASRR